MLVVNFCTSLSETDLEVRVNKGDRDSIELMHVVFDAAARTMTPYTLRLGAGTRYEPSAAIPLYAGNAATALQDYELLTIETAKAEVASAVQAAKAEVASAVAASGAGDKATIASLRAQLAMRVPQHGADFYVSRPQPFSSMRPTSVVCLQLQRGHCEYGDSCKFSHVIDGGGIRGADRSNLSGLKRLRNEETHPPPPYRARQAQSSFGGSVARGRAESSAEPPYRARQAQGSFGGSAAWGRGESSAEPLHEARQAQGSFGGSVARGRGDDSAEGMSRHFSAALPPPSARHGGPPRG